MTGDRTSKGVRRPGIIERPSVPAGPLADLKALVYDLYVAADTPTLDRINKAVVDDDTLDGGPGRDTIHRIIRDPTLPPSQANLTAVVTVLARMARWEPQDTARRARDLWVTARLVEPVGVQLDSADNPFAFEVHPPIVLENANELPLLPPYVRRAHDLQLAGVVDRALAGSSGMAVLVADSSAGKTRACWEALQPMRDAGGWRLWHPYDPLRPEAALESLDQVLPRTVVWLNEIQHYLGAADSDGERVAAKLRSLLADPLRAPVLVFGTLWPEHYTALTGEPQSLVAGVLDGTIIEVPDRFTGDDLTAMREAALNDVRLEWAFDHADSGQITQQVAGGPGLLDRFHSAEPASKALIQVAMDALRMGHRNFLPVSFLAQAAMAYLSDTQWDLLKDDWLERALADTARPCRGVRGPLTRIRRDRGVRDRRSPRTMSNSLNDR